VAGVPVRHVSSAMYRSCLYCDRALTGVGSEALRGSVRLAFDPDRARVWTICDRCHGWNLWWPDDRTEALYELERIARDEARVLFETDHVALLETDERQLVRVGRPPRREEAWWRYGRRLRRRRRRFQSPLTRVGVATYSAVSSVGASMGFSSLTGSFGDSGERQTEILRWRRFGRTAWSGRATCPNCSSVLIRLFFLKSPDLILMPSDGGVASIGLPCIRCDSWSGDRTHRFDATAAEPVLRRVLAWYNIDGATTAELDRAVRLIEAAGSAESFIGRLASERRPLHSLERVCSVALEIAVNERAERARLAHTAAELDAGWQRAEELAAIIDEELEPPPALR